MTSSRFFPLQIIISTDSSHSQNSIEVIFIHAIYFSSLFSFYCECFRKESFSSNCAKVEDDFFRFLRLFFNRKFNYLNKYFFSPFVLIRIFADIKKKSIKMALSDADVQKQVSFQLIRRSPFDKFNENATQMTRQ